MQENFELRIREFHKLKKGWHFGKGEPFSKEHVEIAALIAMRYFKKYNLSVSGTPIEDGAIELTFNKNDTFLDVKIPPELNSAQILYSKGIGKNRLAESWGEVPLSKLDDIFGQFHNIGE